MLAIWTSGRRKRLRTGGAPLRGVDTMCQPSLDASVGVSAGKDLTMNREDARREMARITIEKARRRHIPLDKLNFFDGSYYYPPKKVRTEMTQYEINDANRLLLYYVPENGKWCCGYDFKFYDSSNNCFKKYQEPRPMKDRLFDSWGRAVKDGLYKFAEFTSDCVQNIDKNPNFYDYIENFGN